MDRCPYCFKTLPENGICDCRYLESENAGIEDALHPGTIVGACYRYAIPLFVRTKELSGVSEKSRTCSVLPFAVR